MMAPDDALAIATAQLLRRLPRDKRATLLESMVTSFARDLRRIRRDLAPAEIERRVSQHRASIVAATGDK